MPHTEMTENSVKLTLMPMDAKMISRVTAGKLVTVNGGYGGRIEYVTTDSRVPLESGMFVAISGERFDGHSYIADAIGKGERIILCERVPELSDELPGCDLVVVENTVLALGKLASHYIYESRVRTVAVTGSVGKTTTKELIYSVLSRKYCAHKTEGNKNNEIGLPLTAFALAPDTEYGIFECGMCGLGEIEYLSDIVRPDIAVITNIGSSHLEKLGTRENIARAKLEIVHGMDKSGVLIINGDEPLLTESAAVASRERVITAALHNRNADYRALNIRSVEDKTLFDLIYKGKVAANVEIPLLGTHNVYDALYAFAVGIEAGMTEEAIRIGLSMYRGVAMRQRVYGVRDFTVIEDCYNASPESMRAGIDVLVTMAKAKGKRPVALLGDMKELGDGTHLMHEQVGTYAAEAGIRQLYTYGPLAEGIARAAIIAGIRAENVYVNADSNDPGKTGEMILSSIGKDDILLVKASRSIAAERVIEYMQNKDLKG